MFLGGGAVSSYSSKLKLNMRSSTESKLVSADMYMPEMLWSLYFLRAQGYKVENVELYQDNISAQMLEINGKFSSSKKTKHIRAKFFFIKDRIDSGDIHVIDCPTEVMWADGQSKPLQGRLFRQMRAKLMNCAENYSEDAIDSSEGENKENSTRLLSTRADRTAARRPQECVGNRAVRRNRTRQENGTKVTRRVTGGVRTLHKVGEEKRTPPRKKRVSWAAVVAGS